MTMYGRNVLSKLIVYYGSSQACCFQTFIQDYKNAKIFSSRKKSRFKKLNINYKKDEKTKVLESFIDSIIFKKKPLVSKEDALDVMAISLTLEKSIKTGRWEKVKY